jgi:hypothetical protein
MSDSQNTGFGKFVPGFDFLQNLAKGASGTVPQMPHLAHWVVPTLNVEELEKRIAELKAVQFWLEQNSRALGATVQALEVQKMTLATLKGMNFNMPSLADAPEPQAAEPAATTAKPASATAAGMVDPMQLWGALTQQFQHIAASALKDVGKNIAADLTQTGAAAKARTTGKTAAATGKAGAAGKKTASKTTGKTTARGS